MGNRPKRILQIGNYPPPMCGWAIQTKLVTEELRRRGHVCEVLKINEDRKVKHATYIDVQGGLDYVRKVIRHALAGYRLNVHVNGQSKKGYLLALAAVMVGRLTLCPARVTFHGGLSQAYFPRQDSRVLHWVFKLLFHLAGGIACDSLTIRQAIESYAIKPGKIAVIETFSVQYLEYEKVSLSSKVETFLLNHHPTFFCYVSFRPEYRLEVLREAMRRFHERFPRAGFVWLGFPAKEIPGVEEFVGAWEAKERQTLLLLGNLGHDEFLNLLSRCFAYIRTPACDGVSASVLESLALGVPVVASENGQRPEGVVTYCEGDAADLCSKLMSVMEHYNEIKAGLGRVRRDDNVGRMADWLAGEPASKGSIEVAHAS